MKIEHLAIWVKDLEAMRNFYCQYFNLTASKRYHNPSKDFTSYFLSFTTGARIELMYKPEIKEYLEEKTLIIGFTHFAISLGSQEAVDQLTNRLKKDGFTIIGQPRTTGDGYYESVILDPEGNTLELTV